MDRSGQAGRLYWEEEQSSFPTRPQLMGTCSAFSRWNQGSAALLELYDGNSWHGWLAFPGEQGIPGGGMTNHADTAVQFQYSLYLFAIGIKDHQHYNYIWP